MALGNVTNNPGNLLSSSGNWLGLTGTTQANGLGYDTFDTPTDGVRALAIDLKNAIAGGANTVTTLVAHYLGNPVQNGVIQPTSANPHPQAYLAAVEQVSGLSGNASLTASNVASLVPGFIKGEGSTVSSADLTAGLAKAGLGGQVTAAQSNLGSAFGTLWGNAVGGTTALVTNPFGSLETLGSGFVNNVGTIINATPDQIGSAVGSIGQNQALAVSTVAQASTDTASQATAAAGKQISNSLNGITGAFQAFTSLFSASNLSRGTFLIVGIILLIGAIVFFFADEISEAISKHPEALAAVA